MKYLHRKFKTEGSSCPNSTILNSGAYCHRPWEGPSIAMGGTTFPRGLSVLHWVSLLLASWAWHKHLLSRGGWEAVLHPCGGMMGNASVPQPELSLGVPGMGAPSPTADRQWDLVWLPSRAILEPEAQARTLGSLPSALPSGPHSSPRGVPLCLDCGAQLRQEYMHCWQSAAR